MYKTNLQKVTMYLSTHYRDFQAAARITKKMVTQTQTHTHMHIANTYTYTHAHTDISKLDLSNATFCHLTDAQLTTYCITNTGLLGLRYTGVCLN